MIRRPDGPVDDLFPRRWSPRAMSGEEVTRETLMTLFEAARWAPSAANTQPWRFVFARAATPAFDAFFDLLAEGNKPWCAKASALVLVVARALGDDGKPWRTHAFDTGAAWMSLALQGTLSGLVVHGMGGFDYDRARAVARVPEGFEVQCMVAVGRPGSVDDLPERYRAREAPNGREPVSAFVFEGTFPD